VAPPLSDRATRADIGSLSPCFGCGPYEPWIGEAQARASRAFTASHQACVRRELLDRILIVNSRHAITVLREYEDHFNTRRPHRGLSQAAPLRSLPTASSDPDSAIIRHDRLGGLLHEYAQVA
jgi:putative transposase